MGYRITNLYSGAESLQTKTTGNSSQQAHYPDRSRAFTQGRMYQQIDTAGGGGGSGGCGGWRAVGKCLHRPILDTFTPTQCNITHYRLYNILSAGDHVLVRLARTTTIRTHASLHRFGRILHSLRVRASRPSFSRQ